LKENDPFDQVDAIFNDRAGVAFNKFILKKKKKKRRRKLGDRKRKRKRKMIAFNSEKLRHAFLVTFQLKSLRLGSIVEAMGKYQVRPRCNGKRRFCQRFLMKILEEDSGKRWQGGGRREDGGGGGFNREPTPM